MIVRMAGVYRKIRKGISPMSGCKTGEEERQRRNDDHLQDRREADQQNGDQRHSFGILPAVIDVHGPKFESHGEESADERRDDPRRGMLIRQPIRRPEGIAMNDRESDIDDEHEEEIAPCCFEADPEMLAIGCETRIERRMEIFPEQV